MVNCNGIRRKFHYFMDMAYSPAVDTQRIDLVGNRIGNRVPPENTIPYKYLNPHYAKTIPGHYLTAEDDWGFSLSYKIDGEEYLNIPDDHERASHLIKSPLKNDAATLERGKDRFRIYCSPCHGVGGRADGPVTQKWQGVPIKPLVRLNANEPIAPESWSKERLFMVMTTGISTMPSYATQIPEIDRWAIAHHIKKLQAEARK